MDKELFIEGMYQIVFTGLPVHGTDIKHVRDNFGKKFKLSPQQLSSIFNGGPAVVQKNLDWSKANIYLNAMKEIGALCEIVPGQVLTGDEVMLEPCSGCRSLQIGDVCSYCGFDIKSYRSRMGAKGFVEGPDSDYIKNRRTDPRRTSVDRRVDVRYEEKRRLELDRRKKNIDWYSD